MIQQLEAIIGKSFNNPGLIQRAFNHTSYANEQKKSKLDSNERLEFLGDAVLELIVSEFLYKTYPNLPEGQLTVMRAQLVQEPSLAYLSRQIKLDQALQLGKGEEKMGGRLKDSMIADVYEATLAAIYLDQGMPIAKEFVTKTMLDQHQYLLKNINVDYKTQLQELVQRRGNIKISYQVLEQTGPAHQSHFVVGLTIDGVDLARGQGSSKKAAEMSAAKSALTKIDDKGYVIQTNK